MTLSILGRCPRSGQLGAAAAAPSIAVGARTAFAEARIGVVVTQHRADPRLGPRALTLLRSGLPARQTLATLIAESPTHDWRQIAVLDASSEPAAHSGARAGGDVSEAITSDAIALGSHLANARVPAAMLRGFQAAPQRPLAERLLDALDAGLVAGGSNAKLQSASLLVVEREAFPLIDLRADWHDSPIAELRRLWAGFAPIAAEMITRALDPANARGI